MSDFLFRFVFIAFSNVEVVARRCSIKELFLKILQFFQENTCAGLFFLIKFPLEGLQLY